jgi:hypothetical protein
VNMDRWLNGTDRESPKYSEKTLPLSLFQLQMLLGLTWDRSRASAFERLMINCLTAIKPTYIPIPSPYRAVNTLRLSYTNQSVNVV